MNLTLHIVRKDLMRMRGWIACWAALLLVPIAIGAWLIGHEPFTGDDWDLPGMIAILTGVEVFVGYLLTILIIQEDSVVGTQQFWLTRPIARGRLLTAKALSVLVIVGFVPVAVSLPWWLWCGFGVAQIASAAGEMLIVLMIALLPAAVVAVVTDSFARALLWSVALVAVVMFGGFLFVATNAGVTGRSERDMLLSVTRAQIAIGAVVLEIVVLVIVQYLVRRRGWWLAATGGVMAVSVVAATQWRGSWVSLEPREHHADRGAGVKVQFHRAVAGERPGRTSAIQLQRVGSQLILSGDLPEGNLMGAAAKQRWTWPNGTVLERLEPFYSEMENRPVLGLQTGTSDPETKRAETASLTGRTKREFAPGEFFAEASAWLPPSLVARMQTEPPKFEARLWWRVVRPELKLEVPLAPGRWLARNGHGVGIQRIQRNDDLLSITLVATRPLLLSSLLRALRDPYRRIELDAEQWWALLDRERGRVAYIFGEHHADKPRAIVVHGVKVEWRVHTTGGPGIYRNGKWAREPGWSDGSSLAVLTLHEDAVFSRDVKMERFDLAK